MAGIGFELKKFLSKESYLGTLGAYGFAGLVCSGPWLLSIATILMLSFIANWAKLSPEISRSFQVMVVYIIAGSLILTSVLQHTFTRYIANLCYLSKQSKIIPSLNSVYLVLIVVAAMVCTLLVNLLTPSLPMPTKCLMVSSFIVISLIWISTSLLSAILAYKTILFAFLSNFIVAIAISMHTYQDGLQGLLFSFLCGQFVLLMVLIYTIYHEFPTNQLIDFNFFKLKGVSKMLIFTGLFYNLAIWVDKFIFWYSPVTGLPVIGHLHASLVYDFPIFFAYLLSIPGMTVFLLNLETNYTDAHQRFFHSICGDSTLDEIQHDYIDLIDAGRLSILSSIKAQSLMLFIFLIVGSLIFIKCQLPLIYLPITLVCLLASSLNVVLWSTLDIIFYLDRVKEALIVTAVFTFSNALFTWVSIQLGMFYYGFGLVASLLLSITLGFLLLNKAGKHLQYETYMVKN
ncbi:MAG TPA: exopolysaccharide Pel transporter PelG [Gammaproteobacteria bacterium]|nr:exopolysaccharide Pel transporter PelG [Gammaproteobacteria bacterium]